MVSVTCKQCKSKIDKKEAFYIVEEGKKRGIYFCNEDEYKKYSIIQREITKQKELDQIEKQKFNEVDVYIAAEILGYEIGQITPPFLKKRVKKLAESYDYEVIKLCFETLKNDLHYYLNNRDFHDEQHKVNYIMVVIENNINDVYKKWKREKTTQMKQKKMDEVSCVELTNIPLNTQKQKTNDISSFLMGDDL